MKTGPRSRAHPTGSIQLALAAAILGIAIGLVWLAMSGAGRRPGEKRAAIVDQLGATNPNPAFVNLAAQLLSEAGFRVARFEASTVNVPLFRSIRDDGYDLIVLRAHTGRVVLGNSSNLTDDAIIFTSEPYGDDYLEDQAARRVGWAEYPFDGRKYYGILPAFFRAESNRGLDGTVVIEMGCNGLRSTSMARAFVDAGASAYVGWNGDVTAKHTDEATAAVLRHLVEGVNSVAEAVEFAMQEVGPDPVYGSRLSSYSQDIATATDKPFAAPEGVGQLTDPSKLRGIVAGVPPIETRPLHFIGRLRPRMDDQILQVYDHGSSFQAGQGQLHRPTCHARTLVQELRLVGCA